MTEQYVIIPAVVALALAMTLFAGILIQRALFHVSEWQLQRALPAAEPLLMAYMFDELPGARLLAQRHRLKRAYVHLLLRILPQLAGSTRDKLLSLARDLRLVKVALYDTRDLSWRKRELAAMRLGMIGDAAAVPALRRLLRDPRREVRYTATRSLALIGSPEAFEAVLKLLHRPRLVDTPRVLEIVQAMQRPDVEPLRRFLLDEQAPHTSRLVLMELVADWREHRLTETMRQLVQHENPEIVIRAIKALTRIGDHDGLPLLLEHIDHPRWEIRAQVVRAAGELQFAEAVPLIKRALTDQAYWVRRNAAQALAVLGGEDEQLLDPDSFGEDHFAHDMARYQLERMGLLEPEIDAGAISANGGANGARIAQAAGEAK